MRLIDADALKYTRVQIFHGLRDNGKPLVGGMNAVVMSCAIKDAPTIEAEPVRHGRWVTITECSNEGVYCSLCNKKVYRADYAWCVKGNKMRSNYCPNCGAKMDLEEVTP